MTIEEGATAKEGSMRQCCSENHGCVLNGNQEDVLHAGPSESQTLAPPPTRYGKR
jgi:hypothetical protein